MTPSAPPTTEIGTSTAAAGLPGWSSFIDEQEHVPELTFPSSVLVFDRMRTDSQVEALMLGMKLPIRRRRWLLDPNGAKPAVVDRLAEDLDLDIAGQEPRQSRGRRKGRFTFDQHLPTALLALEYGFYFFEQVGQIDGDGSWRLRKLAARPPRTIGEINVERDGGLKSIKQNIAAGGSFELPQEIPVTRLLAYVWGQEPGQWTGRSLLRPMYRHWLRKDRLLRVDALKQERNGMGIPVGQAPAGATPVQIAEINKAASEAKAGETSGLTIPHGAALTFEGVRGSLPDTIASIRYDDEAMARSVLLMLLQLGQTQTGSRALGGTFTDYVALAQDAIAGWICDTFTPHVIEDMVDWNFGEDETAPRLVSERDEDPELATADFISLIQAGAITVDSELESWLRERHRLPPKPEPSQEPPPEAPPEPNPSPSPAPPAASASALAPPGGMPALPLPPRELRRGLYEHEVAASVDYAALDAAWVRARDTLLSQVRSLQDAQIGQLVEAAAEAGGDPEALSALAASPVYQDAIGAELRLLAAAAATEMAGELRRQGADIADPDPEALDAWLSKRAAAVDGILTRSLGEAAARKAVSLSGGALTATEVAGRVEEHLRGLSTAFLEEQIGGAATAAQNAGRTLVLRAGPPARYYASELLDSNTCAACRQIDGTEYLTLDDAEQAYPLGGYADCEGGLRCRGTLVAVLDESAPALQEPGA